MSSYEFNPFTGSFDKVGNLKGYKAKALVDASFLITPEIPLEKQPITNTEVVTLNGLEIDDTNYSISGTTLTMIVTQLEIGDNVYITHLGCP